MGPPAVRDVQLGSAFYRYREDVDPAFDPAWFDPLWRSGHTAERRLASAGRGSTELFSVGSSRLVVRQYLRGGLIRHLSERRYVWCGLDNTRAMHEFQVLLALENLGLPAPEAVAAEVARHGPVYEAALVMRYLPGTTLAARLEEPVPPSIWEAVGCCIRRFHDAGLWHADLNAHNILITDDEQISLIDFDRARWRHDDRRDWRNGNLMRLERSLAKLGGGMLAAPVRAGFEALKLAYAAVTPSAHR